MCRHSKTSQHFMEPEGSIPCSQKPSTGPCPINPAHTIPSYLSKIHFNIVHVPTSWSSQWSLSFWLFHQCPISIDSLKIFCRVLAQTRIHGAGDFELRPGLA
jgi:hypothetical protein